MASATPPREACLTRPADVEAQAWDTVVKAAEWLDSQVGRPTEFGIDWPADWRDRIDLDQLSLTSGRTCVVGQALGGTHTLAAPCSLEGSNRLERSLRPAFLSAHDTYCGDGTDYVPAWRAYITATREQDVQEESHGTFREDVSPTMDTERSHSGEVGGEVTDRCPGETRSRIAPSSSSEKGFMASPNGAARAGIASKNASSNSTERN